MYNARATIVRALDSIKNQTIISKSIEIIVINDGSTDNGAAMVDEYIRNNQQLNIQLINKENGGVSSARNTGIEKAAGEWVAFLDADDIWHPQKLAFMMPFVKAGGFILYSHGYGFEENGFAHFPSDIKLQEYKSEISLNALLWKNYFVTPSVIIKKGLLFDKNMHYAEDHDLWIRTLMLPPQKAFFLKLKLVNLNRPVLSKGGASENKWEMRKGELLMYLKLSRLNLKYKLLLPVFTLFSLFNYFRKTILK